jgi:formamidopyrimidine-DNA glycosylase
MIQSSQVYWARTLAYPSVDQFQAQAAGQTILDVRRRGKFILFDLPNSTLFIHLRMSGDLFIEPAEQELKIHNRLVLNFEGGFRLVFNDPRKFGRVWLVDDPQMILKDLGPEPLDPAFTDEEFYLRLHSRRRQLKPLLMDQTFLAGLGNIYTDEALHLARLHPLFLSNLLTRDHATCLLAGIRQVLEEGIRRNGASIDWVYRGGDFQNYFRVYQRTGQPCPQCSSPIERIVVGQRSTHFCPACQLLVR